MFQTTDQQAEDYLAWYLFIEGYTDPGPAVLTALRQMWAEPDPADLLLAKRRDDCRRRAAAYLHVASSYGDGQRPTDRCNSQHPDPNLIAYCYLAPGHRDTDHMDYPGRTWPVEGAQQT